MIIGPGQTPRPNPGESGELLQRATRQLEEYFAGARTVFDLPIKCAGTEFQQSIWRELANIPYGTSVTYQELGNTVGVPQGARAVGGAVGKNPVPIIVPCHRVLGAGHKITGYSGGEGIPTKEKLLALEGISYR